MWGGPEGGGWGRNNLIGEGSGGFGRWWGSLPLNHAFNANFVADFFENENLTFSQWLVWLRRWLWALESRLAWDEARILELESRTVGVRDTDTIDMSIDIDWDSATSTWDSDLNVMRYSVDSDSAVISGVVKFSSESAVHKMPFTSESYLAHNATFSETDGVMTWNDLTNGPGQGGGDGSYDSNNPIYILDSDIGSLKSELESDVNSLDNRLDSDESTLNSLMSDVNNINSEVNNILGEATIVNIDSPDQSIEVTKDSIPGSPGNLGTTDWHVEARFKPPVGNGQYVEVFTQISPDGMGLDAGQTVQLNTPIEGFDLLYLQYAVGSSQFGVFLKPSMLEPTNAYWPSLTGVTTFVGSDGTAMVGFGGMTIVASGTTVTALDFNAHNGNGAPVSGSIHTWPPGAWNASWQAYGGIAVTGTATPAGSSDLFAAQLQQVLGVSKIATS